MSVASDAVPESFVQRRSSDSHGEAALLLSESLIHTLLAREALSLHDALDIVQGAIDAQIETDHASGLADGQTSQALALLLRIRASLSIDLNPQQKSEH